MENVFHSKVPSLVTRIRVQSLEINATFRFFQHDLRFEVFFKNKLNYIYAPIHNTYWKSVFNVLLNEIEVDHDERGSGVT